MQKMFHAEHNSQKIPVAQGRKHQKLIQSDQRQERLLFNRQCRMVHSLNERVKVPVQQGLFFLLLNLFGSLCSSPLFQSSTSVFCGHQSLHRSVRHSDLFTVNALLLLFQLSRFAEALLPSTSAGINRNRGIILFMNCENLSPTCIKELCRTLHAVLWSTQITIQAGVAHGHYPDESKCSEP